VTSTPIVAARTPRAPHAKAADPATGAADSAADAQTQAQEHTLAVQRQTFDFAMEENSELEREREALAQLMIAQLKDEDEIVKKWIEMI
jgi:hypothetical protein